MADREGVQVFQADIIYHLFDRFTEYKADIVRRKKEAGRSTYYSASPGSCKALQSTTLTPARELDRRRHHTGLALDLPPCSSSR